MYTCLLAGAFVACAVVGVVPPVPQAARRTAMRHDRAGRSRVNFLANCMLEFSLCSLKIVRGTWGKVACFSVPFADYRPIACYACLFASFRLWIKMEHLQSYCQEIRPSTLKRVNNTEQANILNKLVCIT